MPEPLNPTLYALLERAFAGRGGVLIAKEGQQASGYEQAVVGGRSWVGVENGEEYRVCCPFCEKTVGSADSGHHLYIGHLWGVPDRFGRDRWYNAICFRGNDCLSRESGNFQTLKSMVYHRLGPVKRSRMHILEGTLPPPMPQEVELPGDCFPLVKLRPSHEAIAYLQSRNFNPYEIAEKYSLSICLAPRLPYLAPACNRLIIPVFSGGKMIGWQARLIGDSSDYPTSPYDSKYWNCPDWKKGLCLYALDQAVGQSQVVLVEGVTDVWRMGDGAVALFGKSLSARQRDLVRENWPIAVVMLDNDAYRSATVTAKELSNVMMSRLAELPPDCDPADLTKEQAWQYVARAIDKPKNEFPSRPSAV
jgi:hypothetical protein